MGVMSGLSIQALHHQNCETIDILGRSGLPEGRPSLQRLCRTSSIWGGHFLASTPLLRPRSLLSARWSVCLSHSVNQDQLGQGTWLNLWAARLLLLSSSFGWKRVPTGSYLCTKWLYHKPSHRRHVLCKGVLLAAMHRSPPPGCCTLWRP